MSIALDRKRLGLRRFWRKLGAASELEEPIAIATGCADPAELPKDLRLLLHLAREKDHVVIESPSLPPTIAVITPPAILTIALSFAAIVITALFTSRRYKFRVMMKDGLIDIEGVPAK
jgi:hypothetical protein